MRTILALLCLLAASGVGRAEEANTCPGNPAALGTSRLAVIGDEGPLALGLKTYPRTLKLADHEVVLTFDDGPSRKTTPAVLDALQRECVHATFFLIGRNAASAANLVRREIASGHTVGHHTFSHPAVTLRGLPTDKAEADVDRGFAADDKAGYGASALEPQVPFFRFPGFADTPALDAWLADRHVAVFGADLWASDWIKMTPDEELDLLMRRLEATGRGIILLHDIKEQTAAMLPKLLETLKERHYRVVHMVPGHGPTETMDAPAGWHSETEATLAAIVPRLARHAAHIQPPANVRLRGTGQPLGEPAATQNP